MKSPEEIYHTLKEVTDGIYHYDNQMVAISHYISQNFEEKKDSNCQHLKREYIAELNSDLCLVCGTLIKE